MLPFIVIFMIFVAYNIYIGNYATYYYFKFYYLLLLLLVLSVGIEYVLNSKNKMYVIMILYLFVLSLCQVLNVEQKITEKNLLLNPIHSVSATNDIIRFNSEIIQNKEPIFTEKQLKDLDKIINDNSSVISNNNLVADLNLLQKLWIYSLYNISVSQIPDMLGSYYNEIDYDYMINNADSMADYLLTTKDKYDSLDSKYKKKLNEVYNGDSYILYEVQK